MRQNKTRGYYLTTRELITMAVLSALGGVLSTYVGYLGNLLNQFFGVPFGAGQFMGGLHVFWFIVLAGLVRKPGAVLAAGLLKGLVEFLTGSTHGVVIVLVCVVQAAAVDAVVSLGRRSGLGAYLVAGAAGTVSEVVLMQLLYFSGAPAWYILLMIGLAAVSGVIFAGYLGSGVLDLLHYGRIAAQRPQGSSAHTARFVITLILGALLAGGAVYYYAFVFEPSWASPAVTIEGKVSHPYTYREGSFPDSAITVTAELKGSVTYVPPRDYTGVPIRKILTAAQPDGTATKVTVSARDGYSVEFPLTDLLKDEKTILIREKDGSYRLIAPEHAGGYWVRQVTRIKVE
ncbi:MAG: energy-coupling factor transport system permease protein [Bacillota bacterium]|nr:energy-coupling factor transport system permease protein [Bacillota bacterium]MDK2856236.1 energy-coupling factor transport system permease protein [Bacillota bacterium]MDK2926066.1 energy-coupling factor transport system permease protein [Bacillota bacterium]